MSPLNLLSKLMHYSDYVIAWQLTSLIYLYQAYRPQICTTVTTNSGCVHYVCVQTVPLFIYVLNDAVLVIKQGIVCPDRRFALAPDAHLKSKTWRYAACPFPFKVGWPVSRVIQR